MTHRDCPKLLEMAWFAKRSGWNTKRVRRVLVKAGLANKVGGRWVSTRRRVRPHFPELVDGE
jgi:hypothetical protein